MKRVNRKGQVAVEFLLMFIIVISVIIYAFYFAFSLASLHYKTYVTFMVGRSVLASSKNYQTTLNRAKAELASFESSDVAKTQRATTNFECSLDASPQGFRGILNYGNPVRFDVFTNAGIACSMDVDNILPSVLTGSSGNSLKIAIESMTGAELSEDHCKCLMDFSKKWGDCLNEVISGQAISPIDNGC